MLTYLEPQNPEYRQFVETLKSDAKKLFNFTIEDSLVPTHCDAVALHEAELMCLKQNNLI